jgi:hypothetical protein
MNKPKKDLSTVRQSLKEKADAWKREKKAKEEAKQKQLQKVA